jgi:hypothetical protein
MTNDVNVAYIAMTCSWPGGWAKGSTIVQARKRLRAHWGSLKDYKVAVYKVHPNTTMNEMGGFSHPRGHKPELVEGGKDV